MDHHQHQAGALPDQHLYCGPQHSFKFQQQQQHQHQHQQQQQGYHPGVAGRGGIPLPAPGHNLQQQKTSAHSTLIRNLQAATASRGAPAAPAMPAMAGAMQPALAPVPALAPAKVAQQAYLPAQASASFHQSGWQSAYSPQLLMQQQQQQQRQVHHLMGGSSVASWPTLQPHTGAHELFNANVHPATNLVPLVQQPAQGACARQESRRVWRRRPTVRRSLLNLFDAAWAIEGFEDLTDDSDDSDCEVLGSQDLEQSSYTPFTPFPPPFAASPGTPYSQEAPAAAPSPVSAGDPASPASTPMPDALHASSHDSPSEHMVPLQHLLMSERAQHLTALEVKAIIYKVAAGLATLHDAGVLHRHVTIASVALSRSGNMATTRLMGHPYNVDAGQGRRYSGGKKSGVDAYLAPELARCPVDCVAYTPAGDMWSLGIVLFVLLSGSHVPFGNRGLCWTSIPNMPGPQESVDKLQHWLEEHLVCKLSVINQLKQSQDKGKTPVCAGPEMRVVGLNDAACDLLMRLLAADPGGRPTARQVLRHAWLAEVQGLIPSPKPEAPPGTEVPDTEMLAASSVFEANLQWTASEPAQLGFHPGDKPVHPSLQRPSSNVSMASSDFHFDNCLSGASSAHASSACLAEMMTVGSAGSAASAYLMAPTANATRQQPVARAQQAGPAAQASTMSSTTSHSFVLDNGTALQLLPPQAVVALVAGGLLPDPDGTNATLPYPTVGFAVQPVEVEVEGQRIQLSVLHAVLDVKGAPMLCAQPVAVTQQMSSTGTQSAVAASNHSTTCTAASAVYTNPDLDTSAPILPLLDRMLQQNADGGSSF